jgi:hypothetical protein
MGGVDARRIYFVPQVLPHLNEGEGMLFSSRLLSRCRLCVLVADNNDCAPRKPAAGYTPIALQMFLR